MYYYYYYDYYYYYYYHYYHYHYYYYYYYSLSSPPLSLTRARAHTQTTYRLGTVDFSVPLIPPAAFRCCVYTVYNTTLQNITWLNTII